MVKVINDEDGEDDDGEDQFQMMPSRHSRAATQVGANSMVEMSKGAQLVDPLLKPDATERRQTSKLG